MKNNLQIIRILCIFTLFLNFRVYASDLPQGEPVPSQEEQGLVVVELFTSQGCSSCPPADEILAGFTRDDSILALSYSVDYWNYLGWKDTLAQKDCTIRQQKYNISLGKNGVYTPQMVIQGRQDMIGSKESLAQEAILSTRQAMRDNRPHIPKVTFGSLTGREDDMISLTIQQGHHGKNATIWVIGYDFEKTVQIKGGELNGHTRTYHNVVQAIKRIGSWMGEDVKLTLSKRDIGTKHYDGYALLLQEGEVGPIIAAAKLNPR